jgi:integrase
MASYLKRKTKKGFVWDARFRIVQLGNVVNKSLNGYSTKKEAEFAVMEFMRTYKATEKPVTEITFGELYLLYRKHIGGRLKRSSIATATMAIETHILPYFGKSPLSKITKKEIAEWQDTINANPKRYSYKYKSELYAHLARAFNYAVEYLEFPANPTSKTKNFRNLEGKKEMLFWTDAEFRQFISIVDSVEYKAFFSFLYLTGARRGALALTWSDFRDNYVTINKACDFHVRGVSYSVTSPKNKTSCRKILLPDKLIKLLIEHKALCSKGEGFSGTSFIFGGHSPFPPETIRRKFKHYAIKAGVKKIRIHDFRHSHASLLINNGQNVLAVAARLGHSDIEQTLNRYSHFFDKEQEKLVSAINIDF